MNAELPLPGLLLGDRPERRAPRRSAAAAVLHALTGLTRQLLPDGSRRYRNFVLRVRAQQQGYAGLDAAARLDEARRIGARLRRDGLRDDLLAQALALAAQAGAAALAHEVYDEQILAARIVLDGRLAEMATGEGKTLAIALAAAAAALAGIPVHVLTANDYLVGRDAERLRPLYAALGLSVGAVTQPASPDRRCAAYACSVTYCTARELVFDYLRDQLAPRSRDPLLALAQSAGRAPLLRGLCLAIIDEADSLLIDEARTPLVISQAAGSDAEHASLQFALAMAAELDAADYTIDAAARSVVLTSLGRTRVAARCAGRDGLWRNDVYRDGRIAQAVAALRLFHRDRHYLVRDGRVHIIDEATGRIAEGRVWSQGMQQLVELKENCPPSVQAVTLTQITYQRFFPRYLRLGGMSGTLAEARGELHSVYGLATVRVPLRKPSRRERLPARVFGSRSALWHAVAARTRQMVAVGRPVLIGTDSVADSEALAEHLALAGIAYRVLNARFDRNEARLVAAAGEAGRVTVATNMAGRGTDIVLGSGVAECGGLHVICCQLNAARRIDRQLAGRGARQGDPGSVEVLLSLDADLAVRHLPAPLLRLGAALAPRNPLLRAMLRAVQRFEERLQRRQRARLLAADRQLERRLSFGGISE